MGKKQDSQVKKGLPKRANTSHPKHAKRMGHAARAQAKKNARRAAQEQRAAANAARREAGLPTPWEMAKAKRYEARH